MVEWSKCGDWFHRMCERIPEDIFMKQSSKIEWLCRSCLNSKWNPNSLIISFANLNIVSQWEEQQKHGNWEDFFFCISLRVKVQKFTDGHPVYSQSLCVHSTTVRKMKSLKWLYLQLIYLAAVKLGRPGSLVLWCLYHRLYHQLQSIFLFVWLNDAHFLKQFSYLVWNAIPSIRDQHQWTVNDQNYDVICSIFLWRTTWLT